MQIIMLIDGLTKEVWKSYFWVLPFLHLFIYVQIRGDFLIETSY